MGYYYEITSTGVPEVDADEGEPVRNAYTLPTPDRWAGLVAALEAVGVVFDRAELTKVRDTITQFVATRARAEGAGEVTEETALQADAAALNLLTVPEVVHATMEECDWQDYDAVAGVLHEARKFALTAARTTEAP